MDIEGGKNGFKLPQERLLVVFAAIDVCKGGYKAVVVNYTFFPQNAYSF